MKQLYVLMTLAALSLIACSKPAPPVEADLTGYELEQVPGSEFYKAVLMKDDQKASEGYVLNGRKNGMWMEYGTDGKVSLIEHYIDGKRTGPSINFDTRGQIVAWTDYSEGELNGLKGTYKFGRPEEELQYKNGQLNGVSKKYYHTGKLMEEHEYSNNILNGYYRHYNEEGALDLEYLYKNGDKVSGGIVEPDTTPKEQ